MKFSDLDRWIERRPWLMNFFFGLLALLIYLPILPSDLFPIDDEILLNLPVFQAPLSPQTFRTIFTLGNHVDFYPLRDLTYLFDWKLFAAAPLFLHLHGLVLLLLSVFLLQILLKRLGASPAAVALAPWIWCLLPHHLEMVAWVSARKDLLSLFYALAAALIFFLAQSSAHRLRWYAFSMFLFGLGCLAKANFVLLPLLGLAFYIRQRRERLFFFAASLLGASFAFLNSWFYSVVNPMSVAYSWNERKNNVLSALAREFVGWFIPHFNILEIDGFRDEGIVFPLVGVLLLIAIFESLFRGIGKRKGTQWMIPLGILLLFLPVPNVLSPHRFFYSVRYLEPICLFLTIVFFVRIPKIPATILAACALFFGGLSYVEAHSWESFVRIAHKAYSRRPGVGTGTQLLLALKNLERGGRLSVEGEDWRPLLRQVTQRLESECLGPGIPAPRVRDCASFYQVGFESSRADESKAMDFYHRAHESLEGQARWSRIEMEMAFRRGDREAIMAWNRRWLPLPEWRIFQWSAACLRGEDPSQYRFFEKLLLEREGVKKFIALEAHPSLRSDLYKCLPGDR